MAPRTSSPVKCPPAVAPCGGYCGGETVMAHYGTDTVEVEPCAYVLAQGWTGMALVLWHSQALDYLVPAGGAVQHAEGLAILGR